MKGKILLIFRSCNCCRIFLNWECFDFEETLETKSEEVLKDNLAVDAKVKPSKESKSEEAGKAVYKEDTRKLLKKLKMKSVHEYNKTKQNPTTSVSAGPGPPPSTSTIKPVFDYNTLTYEDLSDPDWISGSDSFCTLLVFFQNTWLGVFWYFLDKIKIWKKKHVEHELWIYWKMDMRVKIQPCSKL